MFLFALGIGAVLLLIVALGAIHFGVDSRDGWAADPTNGLGVDTIQRNLR